MHPGDATHAGPAAADRLAELCLLKVSNDTIRRVSEEEGAAAQTFLSTSEVPAQAFAKGAGQAEFYTDGVTVNTIEGWRDLRVNVFDKREAGEAATPQNWGHETGTHLVSDSRCVPVTYAVALGLPAGGAAADRFAAGPRLAVAPVDGRILNRPILF